MPKKIRENSDAIFVEVVSTVLSVIFVGTFSGAIWVAVEYSNIKSKIDIHQEKISKLEDVIYSSYKSRLDELPTVAEKVHTDRVARNILESKIPPENFSSILGILKNNDAQNAKEKLLQQGLVSSEQLYRVFKSPLEKTTIQDNSTKKLPS